MATDTQDTYRCGLCGDTFNSRPAIEQHTDRLSFVQCPRCGRETAVKLPVEPTAVTTDIGLDLRDNAPPDGRSIGECSNGHEFVVFYYEKAGFDYLRE